MSFGSSEQTTKAGVVGPEKLFTPDQLQAMKEILPQLKEGAREGLTAIEKSLLRTTGIEQLNKATAATRRNLKSRIAGSGVRGGVNKADFRELEEARIGGIGELEAGIGKLAIDKKGSNLDRLLSFIQRPRAQVAGGKTKGSSFGVDLFSG